MNKLIAVLPLTILTGCAITSTAKSKVDLSVEASAAIVKISVIEKGQVVSGSGTWLTKDKIITAAHLFTDMHPGDKIVIQQKWKSSSVSIQAIDNPARRDLAVLKVTSPNKIFAPENWQVHVCSTELKGGEPLVVASGMYGFIVPTFSSPEILTYLNKGPVVAGLTGSFDHGVSGSAVFEQNTGCLAGIVSQEEVVINKNYRVYSTRIVTSGDINDFLSQNKILL